MLEVSYGDVTGSDLRKCSKLWLCFYRIIMMFICRCPLRSAITITVTIIVIVVTTPIMDYTALIASAVDPQAALTNNTSLSITVNPTNTRKKRRRGGTVTVKEGIAIVKVVVIQTGHEVTHP